MRIGEFIRTHPDEIESKWERHSRDRYHPLLQTLVFGRYETICAKF